MIIDISCFTYTLFHDQVWFLSVFDILLRYTENSDWKEAFYKVIPQRKILSPKDLVSSAKPISEQSDGQVVQHDNDTSIGLYDTASKAQNIKCAFDGKSSISEDQ